MRVKEMCGVGVSALMYTVDVRFMVSVLIFGLSESNSGRQTYASNVPGQPRPHF